MDIDIDVTENEYKTIIIEHYLKPENFWIMGLNCVN